MKWYDVVKRYLLIEMGNRWGAVSKNIYFHGRVVVLTDLNLS
jgi:hypothetical protein